VNRLEAAAVAFLFGGFVVGAFALQALGIILFCAPARCAPASAQKRMIPCSRSTKACGIPSACSANAPTTKPPKRNATASVPIRFAPARAAITIAM
jgi:hypothetical protein